jgi:pimeloyl-ACP methyl ester carboxylesterase
VTLLAACAGGEPPTGSTASAAGPGRFQASVDIGDGRRLYLSCSGRGSPTVILEAGYHDSSALWSFDEPTPPAVGPSVQDRLAERVRVCAYDRPGTVLYGDPVKLTTRSTPVAQPRTAMAAVRDLHALVEAAQLTTPIVIVAHSFGGLLARLYAQTHPTETAAVVFVDAFPVTIPTAMGEQWPAYRELLTNPGTAFDSDPTFERFDIDASVAEVAAAPAFPAVPTAVISKTEPFPVPPTNPIAPILERVWPEQQQSLVDLRPGTPHVIATGSDHYVQVSNPDVVADTAQLVIGRIAP